jgi:ankyrin repeat protein
MSINQTTADKRQYTLAAQEGRVQVINVLVQFGADVNLVDNNNVTPIMAAGRYGHIAAITALAAAGGNIDSPCGDGGCPPIFVAARYGQVASIQTLASLGASIDALSVNGFTAIVTTSEYGQVGAI